jgi:hypothetical protein
MVRKTMHWVSKMPTSQLLVWCYVILKMEGWFTFLPPWVVGQQLASTNCTMLWTLITCTCKMLELDDWEPKNLQARLRSKKTLFLLELLPPFELSQYLLDGPYSWNYKPSNYIFSCCPTYTTIQISETKPMHMVFWWCAMKLYLKP